MSETTGWIMYSENSAEKTINGVRWWIERTHEDAFRLRISGSAQTLTTRPTIEECQILAHATARLWAGEKE